MKETELRSYNNDAGFVVKSWTMFVFVVFSMLTVMVMMVVMLGRGGG